jgi:hypothetical protein
MRSSRTASRKSPHQQGKSRDLHGEIRSPTAPGRPAMSTSRCSGTASPPFRRCRTIQARHVGDDAVTTWPGSAGPCRATEHRLSLRPTSTATSASASACSPRPRPSGRPTTAPQDSGSAWACIPRPSGWNAAFGGSDLNPYLACAALLAAGLDGIERKLELEPERLAATCTHRDGIREIPHNLRESRRCCTGSQMLRAAFGDDVVDHYHHAAQWEISEQDRVVTDFEAISAASNA